MELSFNFGLKTSSIFLTLVCLALSLRNRRYKPRQFSGFLALCSNVILSALLASILTLFQLYPDWVSDQVRFIFEGFYAFIHDLIGPLLMLYIFQIIGSDFLRKRWVIVLFALPSLFLETMIVINFFNPFLFTYENTVYTHGPLWILLVIIPSLYFLGSFVYLFLRRKAISPSSFTFLLFGFVLNALGVIGQNFFDTLKVELFCESLMILIFYLTVENIDQSIDSVRDVYNKSSLNNEIRRRTYLRHPFTALDIRLYSPDGGFSFLDSTQRIELEKNIADELKKDFPVDTIFYYARFHFVVLTEEGKATFPENTLEKLGSSLNKQYAVGGDLSIGVESLLTMINYPEQASGEDELTAYLAEEESPTETDKSTDSSQNLARMRRALAVEQAIQTALINNTLDIALQPMVSADETMDLTSMEVFVRLHDEKLGDIAPSELIPIAEKNGTISQIGKVVLRKSCDALTHYGLLQIGVKRLHINVSDVQLLDESLADEYLSIVHQYFLEPSYFVFEVTPSAETRADPSYINSILKLRKAGFLFVYDRFGRLSTNLIQILNENIYGVKVDSHVLWSAMGDSDRKLLLTTTMAALKANGKKLFQNGVETKPEADFSRSTGADYMQGYYFGKPMKEEELPSFVRSHTKDSSKGPKA